MWDEQDRIKLEENINMELKLSPTRILRHAIKQLEILIAMDEDIPTTFQSFRMDVAIGEIIGGLEQYLVEIRGGE